MDTIWQINSYLQNYIDERYLDICGEILSKKLKNHPNLPYRSNGITCNNIFEELVFVTLYESNLFAELQKNISFEIYDLLNNLPQNEVKLLLLKDVDPLGPLEKRGIEFIAAEMLTVINNKLVDYFSDLSDEKYALFTKKVIGDIKDFTFNSSVAGDYNTSNYWEEYCVILQEGYDILYELCYGDIYSHIEFKLEKSSNPDLTILYSGTDEIYVEDYNNPFSPIDISIISEKLYESVKLEASYEDISHCLYSDEDEN
ncbi:hypothetical protein [Psychrobacillus sp. FJAT-21963]|uniref:hypothetical protein n=1 Tax=Psychrobacillus sp. FJAT-21963 TaxID=1712028 RepID=UPI0006F9775F|nr:hypothetical protein [Psychrobacillus sp. FJAT-21963]KQL33364.1 hypothetical protein AN959_17555 [Psychrobacillus sp. FJAT-21963]